MAEEADVKGLIGWFAKNHVAANLLMMCIAVLGLYGAFNTKKEMFPEANFDQIRVQVAYNGGSPEEVERGVVVKIEEAIETIKGIRRVDSVAGEGMGSVNIEIESDYELADVMDEIKLAIDSISTFPGETERPIISKFTWRNQALAIQVSGGDLDEASLKELADRLRDEMLARPGISYVEVRGARPFEISIEVSEDTMRQYGLTLDQVSQIIRRWSIDLPGGTIKADSGNIRLRATGQAYTGEEFANILILTEANGTRVRLGDIATIRDGFAETESYSFFNGERSFGLVVQANDDEDPIQVSAAARAFVEERSATLPPGVKITPWGDTTELLSGRMDMMMKNMIVGALLVFVILGLFLHAKIAFWVVVGTAVAFLGAFTMIESVGVTINLMSLFGFILVLGIVVDDAIIIAESSYAETEKQGYSIKAIVEGAQRVAVPATFGVLTTIMAFAPLVLFLEGRMASFSAAVGWVVIFCLLFSLIESKLILPSHLAIMRDAGHGKRGITEFVDRQLKRFIHNVYQPLLRGAITHRWITIVSFISMAILTLGIVGGGYVRIVFAPEFEADFLSANVELREGAPDALIAGIIRQMDGALREVNDEIVAERDLSEPVIKNMSAWIGGSTAGFQVELAGGDERIVSPKEIETRWREKVGGIAGTQTMEFRSMNRMGGGGPPIAFRLIGRDFDLLEAAAGELADHLRTYDGLYEVTSSAQAGPEEIKLSIKPEAESLGITLADLAGQVRQAFYGAESQRIQRGDSEVRVMVRYPRSERRSIGNLENMWIRSPDGREVPFYAVASYDLERGYSSIKRVDGQRAISVTANADLTQIEPGRLIGQVYASFVPELLQRYPGVRAGLDGAAVEDLETQWEMFSSFGIALLGIYVLMAIPLKSYLQPLLIMVSIPFGIVGAVVGHLIVGIPLSSVSFIGIVALAGVVVNDSLIMVDFVNKRVAGGMSVMEAAIESGMSRFRAITLTSLTTFFGLVPLVLEKSMQAQIVVPMAVSLAFGIVFSTIITLILVPVCYSMLAEIKAFVRGLMTSPAAEPQEGPIAAPQSQGSIGGG